MALSSLLVSCEWPPKVPNAKLAKRRTTISRLLNSDNSLHSHFLIANTVTRMNFLQPLRRLLPQREFRCLPGKRAFTCSVTTQNQHPHFSSRMATTEPSLPEQSPAVPTPAEPSLPKLSQHDFRIYNRMAEHMDYFHNHFRETWNVLYSACETGKRSKGMSIRQFISLGQQFCSQLEMHHGIEERYVKPSIRLSTQNPKCTQQKIKKAS